jgi:hypothetical protein
MDLQDNSFYGRFKWHIVIISIALAIVILLAMFTDVFISSEVNVLQNLILLLGALVFLSALLAMLSRLFKIVDALKDNSTKLEEVAGALEKIHTGLAQINHSTRLSEKAKAIAFRDEERRSLREAVFDKLQQHDFDAAYEIINEIDNRPEYKELAEQLRAQADKYRTATDQERISQVITHIEKMLEDCLWAKASAQIERLIENYPDSEKAKAMRQKLLDKKEGRKKILLAAWDDAVQTQDTDRSLTILKDLDMYLTPNEALALQEAAKDVFRNKLHDLGVQFSIAVSEKRWTDALDIGQRIVSDFPNSRMADEIREKLDVLKQNVQMQSS